MKPNHFWLSVILLTFGLFCSDLKAATFVGRVMEINDGDIITVLNQNRPIKVKLLGIDAPESKQPFGDVAKKHLYDLVFGRIAAVEYWGLGENTELIGRVSVDGVDICAQMIRDGVAWYDPSSPSILKEADRQMYRESELAARSEKRGLWQDEEPVAPWAFVKAEKESGKATVTSTKVATPIPINRTVSLRPEPFRWVRIPTAPLRLVSIEPESESPDGTVTKAAWRPFRPGGENFSALLPGNGKQTKVPFAFGNAMIDVSYLTAREDEVVYQMVWTSAPTAGETDEQASKGVLKDFMKGIAEGYNAKKGIDNFFCDPQTPSDVSLKGYFGREFDLSECSLNGTLRVFTRVVDNRRQMYVGAVFYSHKDPNVSRFLKSFTVGPFEAEQKATTRPVR
jgi:endonuclease YncB( thermonuclease family)